MSHYRHFVVIPPRGITIHNILDRDIKNNTYFGKLFTRFPSKSGYPSSVRRRKYPISNYNNDSHQTTFKVDIYKWFGEIEEEQMAKCFNANNFTVIYSTTIACRESSVYYYNTFKRLALSFKKPSPYKFVFEIVNDYLPTTAKSKQYTINTKRYINMFTVFGTVKYREGNKIITNFVLRDTRGGNVSLAVSCLGFLFGSFSNDWELNKLAKKGENFRKNLVKLIMKKATTRNTIFSEYINNAFFFEYIFMELELGRHGIMKLKNEEKHNGMATFSSAVANKLKPHAYLKMLKLYKINLSNIKLNHENKIWFNSWKDVDNLFKSKKKESKTSW